MGRIKRLERVKENKARGELIHGARKEQLTQGRMKGSIFSKKVIEGENAHF